MKPFLRWFSPLFILALPIAVSAQPRRDAIVIFKDGFAIKGKVNEKVSDVIFGFQESGRSFPIFSGQFFIDDFVRNVQFSPHQVTKVYQPKEGEVKQLMQIKRRDVLFQDRSILQRIRIPGVPQMVR